LTPFSFFSVVNSRFAKFGFGDCELSAMVHKIRSWLMVDLPENQSPTRRVALLVM
jgi:hypothetical protein